MQAVHDPEHGLRTGRVVSQVVLMEIVADGRLFLMADTGVTVRPKLASKVEIVRQVVEVAQELGEPCPRVAIMAATEAVQSSMPETVDAAELRGGTGATAGSPGRSSKGRSRSTSPTRPTPSGKKGSTARSSAGPTRWSSPTSPRPTSRSRRSCTPPIAGSAASCKGTTAPVAFMSRSDTAATRLNSLALALGVLKVGSLPGFTRNWEIRGRRGR